MSSEIAGFMEVSQDEVTLIPTTAHSSGIMAVRIALVQEALRSLEKISEILEHYRMLLRVKSADPKIQTKADLAVTQIWRAYAHKLLPNDHIISEEEPTHFSNQPEGVVVFDPIDGTKQYVEGRNNCCVVFQRLEIGAHQQLGDGFALIWEPYNRVMVLGVSGLGVFVTNRKIVPRKSNKSLIVNLASTSDEKTRRKTAHVQQIIEQQFPDGVSYNFLGSASVGLSRFITGEIDLHIRHTAKLWDILPGIWIAHLLGKKVAYYHPITKNVFPISLSTLEDLAARKTEGKEDRKLHHVIAAQSSVIFDSLSQKLDLLQLNRH